MKVPDTSEMPDGERLARTMRGLMGQNDGCIERQEAQGQLDLVASDQLPVDGTAGQEPMWEAMGVKMLPRDGDDIFRGVVLPPGWEKRSTDHAMWSDLVDANGVKRAAIFYKAAFYDRSANIRPTNRFVCTRDYGAPDTVARWVVLDATKCAPIHEVSFPVSADYEAQYAEVAALEDQHGERGGCYGWLKERYPDHADPAAYWDAA